MSRKSRKSYPNGVLLICDSGKKVFDRYMVLYESENGVFPYVGMSENPFHPQGFGQHGEMTTRYSVWGTNDKVIEFETLPINCQALVLQDLESRG
jgi:hypothetical protein